MDLKWKIITNAEDFNEFTKEWTGYIAADTETHGRQWDHFTSRHLMGISLAPESHREAIYVPVWVCEDGVWKHIASPDLFCSIQDLFDRSKLIGHNFTYDWRWLQLNDLFTEWHADTRIMWHLASAPSGPRPYSLKDAQVELLGWEARGDQELDSNVRAKGGKLKNGDHYMADLEILAKYACLDAFSTMELYKKLSGFFVEHDYWDMLSRIMAYNRLLEENTYIGVPCDKEGLERALERITKDRDANEKKFRKLLNKEIYELEHAWADRKAALYKRDYNKSRYLSHPEEWKKFNLNSDADKRELFYDKLKLPVSETTEGGKPSTSADALKHKGHPALEAYLKYEKNNTIISSFITPYVESIVDGRLHPGFNICGTVSYRLSGFKPYLLNAPFDEREVMRHLQVPKGFIGLHADLSAIEPTITAEFSQDPSLLKVFRDGYGDIYLDLALELFPNDEELQSGYNTNIPITGAVKDRFKRQRKIAKVIQLAVQYTGTGHTVSKNLTREGIITSVPQADSYVRAYWRKFKKVQEFNQRLKELNRQQGYLENAIGRIIRVPDPDYKDLSNRFIQSSAHDVLVLWVLAIYRLCEERGLKIRPILLDCHDSTSNCIREGDIEQLKRVYMDGLQEVNRDLGLGVTCKAEIKTFKTMAGLKGEDE